MGRCHCFLGCRHAHRPADAGRTGTQESGHDRHACRRTPQQPSQADRRTGVPLRGAGQRAAGRPGRAGSGVPIGPADAGNEAVRPGAARITGADDPGSSPVAVVSSVRGLSPRGRARGFAGEQVGDASGSPDAIAGRLTEHVGGISSTALARYPGEGPRGRADFCYARHWASAPQSRTKPPTSLAAPGVDNTTASATNSCPGARPPKRRPAARMGRRCSTSPTEPVVR